MCPVFGCNERLQGQRKSGIVRFDALRAELLKLRSGLPPGQDLRQVWVRGAEVRTSEPAATASAATARHGTENCVPAALQRTQPESDARPVSAAAGASAALHPIRVKREREESAAAGARLGHGREAEEVDVVEEEEGEEAAVGEKAAVQEMEVEAAGEEEAGKGAGEEPAEAVEEEEEVEAIVVDDEEPMPSPAEDGPSQQRRVGIRGLRPSGASFDPSAAPQAVRLRRERPVAEAEAEAVLSDRADGSAREATLLYCAVRLRVQGRAWVDPLVGCMVWAKLPSFPAWPAVVRKVKGEQAQARSCPATPAFSLAADTRASTLVISLPGRCSSVARTI